MKEEEKNYRTCSCLTRDFALEWLTCEHGLYAAIGLALKSLVRLMLRPSLVGTLKFNEDP